MNRESQEETTTSTPAPVRKKRYSSYFHLDTRSIGANAIIAALYTALTYSFFFLSYGPIQFRISEFMVLIVFFNPNYVYGLTIGCILSDIYSVGMSAFCTPFDLLFGTLATLLSCLLIPLCKHMALGSLLPAFFNGLFLSIEFTFLTAGSVPTLPLFFYNFGTVALGEVVCVTGLGLIFFYSLTKTKNRSSFYKVINAKRHLNYKW